MITVLLLVIVAVLLFGAAAVRGLIGAAVTGVLILFAFASVGWTGILWMAGALALVGAVSFAKAQAAANDINERAEAARKKLRNADLAAEKTAHITAAIDQDRRLKAEFEAKLRQK